MTLGPRPLHFKRRESYRLPILKRLGEDAVMLST